MVVGGIQLDSLESALAHLTPEQRAHSERVAGYTEAAFAKAAAMNLYIGETRGRLELVAENRPLARLSGLYHDLGKLAGDEPLPEEAAAEEAALDGAAESAETGHTRWGVRMIEELYPRFKSLRAFEQRILTEGARDHHERWDGGGEPMGKTGPKIGYLGRFVAIANELDHRAMESRSEDPIGDVLKDFLRESGSGRFDPEILRAFRACGPSLRRVFNSGRKQSAATPVTDTWIRRRSGRPMRLEYRAARETDGTPVWLAEMRFRGAKGAYFPFDDLREKIADAKEGDRIGTYFLYELCDALRRFETCGAEHTRAYVELPPLWYGQKGLEKAAGRALSDEGIAPERIALILPDAAVKKGGKTLETNRTAMAEAGFRLLTAEELGGALTEERGELLTEDDIVAAALGTESVAAE